MSNQVLKLKQKILAKFIENNFDVALARSFSVTRFLRTYSYWYTLIRGRVCANLVRVGHPCCHTREGVSLIALHKKKTTTNKNAVRALLFMGRNLRT